MIMGKAARHRRSVNGAIRAFRESKYDWDGAGGLPLRGDVACTAFGVYSRDGLGGHLLAPLAPPEVTLNGNGTVEVAYSEHADAGRQLFLTFECRGVISYVKVFADGQTTVEGVIRAAVAGSAAEMAGLFEWLTTE